MKRAFIAAPLIGTIIFVTAVVFVVNVNKAEGNAITQISQEAYHNRINSIVELYRSDAGSLFREDMKAVIERALTVQCWNIFNVEVPNDPRDSPDQKMRNIEAARFASCKAIADNINLVICANKGDDDYTSCLNTRCRGLSGEALNQCYDSSGCSSAQSYGLQKYFENLNRPFNFEGMELSPSNKDKFTDFFNPRRSDGSFDFTKYRLNCQQLIPGVAIDCAAFAKHNLQCCRTPRANANDACPASDVIPGCEAGTFYVRVTPSNPTVFPSLPRIQAKDEAGNYLRAGALGDSGEFLLPINFPLMRYLDASFGFYERLAYGRQVGVNDLENEGILDGICYAGNACTDVSAVNTLGSDPGYVWSTGRRPFSSSSAARRDASQSFYHNVFQYALQALPPDASLEITDGTTVVGTCSRSGGGAVSCDAGAEAKIINDFSNLAATKLEGSEWLAHFGNPVFFTFKLLDSNPTFRVNPNQDNRFCSDMILRFNS